jgi:hypothetical protein
MQRIDINQKNRYLLIVLLCISCQINSKDQTRKVSKRIDSVSNLQQNEIVRADTLWGYLNTDTIKDYMVKLFYKDQIVFDIYVHNGNRYEKILSSSINEHFFSDEEYFKNADLFNDANGGIAVVGFCCGSWKTVESHYYKFNDEVKNWILNKKYTYSYNQDYSINYEVEYPTKSVSINAITYQKINVPTQEERNVYYKDILADLFTNLKSAYTNKTKTLNLSIYPKFILFDILTAIPITKENVNKYNDLAYYLQQTSNEELFAQYLLVQITEIFPNRTVAYINLGDAYWDLENFEKAKHAYLKYISLMKSTGNEKEVPINVWKHVSQ